MRSSVQSAGVSWAGGVRVSSEKRQKGREGRPAGGAAGLLRDGRATARLRQLTDQCAPSKGQGAERHDPPPPGLFQKGYGAAGGTQTREAGEVREELIRKVLCTGASSVNPCFNSRHKSRQSGSLPRPTPAPILSALEHSG